MSIEVINKSTDKRLSVREHMLHTTLCGTPTNNRKLKCFSTPNYCTEIRQLVLFTVERSNTGANAAVKQKIQV